jgi:capsid protein
MIAKALALMTTAAALTFTLDTSPTGIVEQNASGAAAAAQWGYDALDPRGRRKSPQPNLQREDVELRGANREKLRANAADIVKNFSIAAWAVRRHLDYVSRFEFHAVSSDLELNDRIEELVERQSRPTNFDAGGRFSREKFFRVAEACRVVHGDTGVLLLSNGAVQGIESDLIRNPGKIDRESSHEWVDGVEIDAAGYPRRYALWGRERGGIGRAWRKNVAARNFILYGFFDRFASEQVRGVSPIVAALNPLRDVYENLDYALVRSKLAQIFALALTRSADAGALDDEFPPADGGDSDNCDAAKPARRVLDLSQGPTVFDLDVGEKIEAIESKTPSAELQAFSRLVVMIALKALDIPYSFFDESHTNYSGSRTSWLQYERACLDRRDDQLEMRRRWTVFQLQRWILSGELRLPAGMTLADLRWQWIPKGMPWWKPSEELTADLKAIAAGLTSPQQVAAKIGAGDVYDNLRETAEFIAYARDLGQRLLGEPMRVNFDPGPFPSAVTDAASNG